MDKSTLRVRMFAGPNGSGKSTMIKRLTNKFDFEVYLNADEIEEEIRRNTYVDIDKYTLTLSNSDWLNFIAQQPTIFSNIPQNLISNIKIDQNLFVGFSNETNSYIASGITEFLREMLFAAKKSFTFETVMSHPSKVEFLERLKQQGYRVYLYYIATESPLINIGRITSRVKKGGHFVNPEKVQSRYLKSLTLLCKAIKVTDRAYIFDNSGTETIYIAEITSGTNIEMKVDITPNWFDKYVLSESY